MWLLAYHQALTIFAKWFLSRFMWFLSGLAGFLSGFAVLSLIGTKNYSVNAYCVCSVKRLFGIWSHVSFYFFGDVVVFEEAVVAWEFHGFALDDDEVDALAGGSEEFRAMAGVV